MRFSILALTLTLSMPAVAQVTISVDAGANRRDIDPRIYGVAFASTPELLDLGATLNRWGGNAMSRYNWQFSTANRAKDYYFENIPDTVSSGDGSNGKSADDFIDATFAGGAEPVMTIPMMGLLPKDRSIRCGYLISKYGPQQDADFEWRPDCGNGRYAANPHDRMLHVNDPFDTSAVYPASHQTDWIEHLIATHGSAANGGVRYYSLDNEPSLWSADHWDVHPDGSTYDEVWAKMAEYGAAIRATDPNAVITGVEEWGWSGYFMSGRDQEDFPDGTDRANHGGIGYTEWLLQQAAAYEQANGIRIMDVLALHFYPQSGEFSNDISEAQQLRRNRSTRALWDPAYVDESWISCCEGGIVKLIPRLRQWADDNYPGTQIAITEYNWGAESHINGGTAQADILGIFGREGLDMATRWTTPTATSHAYKAFKMYRNYDGNQSRFGNVSVSATGPNPDNVSAFAAHRTADDQLTVMIIAKVLTGTTPVTVNLANFPASGAAQRWQLDSANAITQLANVALSGSSLSLTVPAQSITLLVIPGITLSAPTGVVATATTTSTATINWSPVANATFYSVYRSSGNDTFALRGTTAATTFSETSLTANKTYLYKVVATAGVISSPFSAIDPATTIMFTDDPLVAGTRAKAAHITELRAAVDAMRAAAGLVGEHPPFTNPVLSAGTSIKAVHIQELRTAMDQARAAIGLSALAYTDPTLTAGTTKVKAAHVTDLRNGVK
ncbi:MAG TPA: glycoside hydrolase family 44 protein [Thermoanaerobaculia bacterium]|nr:glycoside hydrolase family 44 protein [Thermoanaerobaculia bacterium]